MKLTTIDIIKILPFEKTLKDDLLKNLASAELEKKVTIEQIIWSTYAALFKIQLQTNIDLALQRAEDGQEILDNTFYKKIRQQTEQEMQKGALEKVATEDLKGAREELSTLLSSQRN